MLVTVRSFAKINLGLCIGPRRSDGFHELRTVYQTIALHDIVRLQVSHGSGIELRCVDPRVPKDESNTCYRVMERALSGLKVPLRVVIEIDKHLPVQGGLGGASANAVAVLLAFERALKKEFPAPEKFRIAAEVGSDLPVFLIGGTVLGVGRGEEVYPLADLPSLPCVIATPNVGVSTPQAFADWDALYDARLRESIDPHDREKQDREGHDFSRARNSTVGRAALAAERSTPTSGAEKLTRSSPSDRIVKFSRQLAAWLNPQQKIKSGKGLSGVPASGRGRAETPLLDLVRTGIENDFEQVVFPKYPELREVKRVLERSGALYAALSGSGSSLYGLFGTKAAAQKAAVRLRKSGTPALVTTTLSRPLYWKKFLVSGF
jgi:4-diphosphocytidyl-2-C-methyl-D-erythritol kinase